MDFITSPITMTIRPRLWRLGAIKVFVERQTPLFRIFRDNMIVAFVNPFLALQTRRNWRKVEWRKPR